LTITANLGRSSGTKSRFSLILAAMLGLDRETLMRFRDVLFNWSRISKAALDRGTEKGLRESKEAS
jgi:hypothetical protein